MNVFLDTNVVIDYMAAREPFCHDVSPIFRNSVEKELNLQVASMTFTTMEYVLKKHIPHDLLMRSFASLRQLVNVIPSTGDVIDSAISSSFTDFEDSVQHFTAQKGGADIIITRNPSDFVPHSIIPIMMPSEFVESYL